MKYSKTTPMTPTRTFAALKVSMSKSRAPFSKTIPTFPLSLTTTSKKQPTMKFKKRYKTSSTHSASHSMPTPPLWIPCMTLSAPKYAVMNKKGESKNERTDTF